MTTSTTGDWMPDLLATQHRCRRRAGWGSLHADVEATVTFDTADIFDRHGFCDGDLLTTHSWALTELLGGRRALRYASGHALLWYVWHHLVAPAARTRQPDVGYFCGIHNPVRAIDDNAVAEPETVTVTSAAIFELAETLFAGRGPGWVAMFDEVYNSVHLANWGATFSFVEQLGESWQDWQLLLAVELFEAGHFGERLTATGLDEALHATLLVTGRERP